MLAPSHVHQCTDVAHVHIPVGFRTLVATNVDRLTIGSRYHVSLETYYERTVNELRMVHRATSGTTWVVECVSTACDDVGAFVDFSLGLRHGRIWAKAAY